MSFFQNSVSFGKSSGKIVFKDDFSKKYKEAFPKTEVLEKPHYSAVISRSSPLSHVTIEEREASAAKRKPVSHVVLPEPNL